MKPHGHRHSHGNEHHHEHSGREHHAATATVNDPSTETALHRHSREGGNPSTAPHSTHGATHHHRLDSRFRANDGRLGGSLLMTGSGQRVLVALGLIALLWSAVAWAVVFVD